MFDDLRHEWRRMLEWLLPRTLERGLYWSLFAIGTVLILAVVGLVLGRTQWRDVLLALTSAIAAAAGLSKTWDTLEPRLQRLADTRTLKTRIGAELYPIEEILAATKDYIPPDFQSVDPGGAEDFRRVVGARETAFAAADRILENPTVYKYLILLADSGMGKTSFLLNYYAYRWRSLTRRRMFTLVLIPLNVKNAESLIASVTDKPNTVLLLDAFDEDGDALHDYKQRLALLLEQARDFRVTVITCRTQFFRRDEEIPTESGVLRIGATRAGVARAHMLHKLYLAPLTDAQVDTYVRRKYPIWRRELRRSAREMTRRIPELVARPMLLAHLDELLKRRRDIEYSYELYETMIDAWLERERGFVQDPAALRTFSERLAVDIFNNRIVRGMERIPGDELAPLASEYGISLPDWQLRSRSLLNRDAAGNYKFAHRSIMEYLCVRSCARGDETTEPWTDLMKTFFVEMLLSKRSSLTPAKPTMPGHSDIDLHGVDLSGTRLWDVDLRRVSLSGADLSRCELIQSKLTNADLSDVKLSRISFRASDLTRVNLMDQEIESPDFKFSYLDEARLQNARLANADFRASRLQKANLTNAVIRGAMFDDASMCQAILTCADFTGSSMVGSDLSNICCENAVLAEIDLRSANLTGVQFRNVNLSGSSLAGQDLCGREFRGAVLTNVDFHGASLCECNFDNSNLRGADLTDADLTGASLVDADLEGALLTGVDLSAVDLSSARGQPRFS